MAFHLCINASALETASTGNRITDLAKFIYEEMISE